MVDCEYYDCKCPIMKSDDDHSENRKVKKDHEKLYCSSNVEECSVRRALKCLEEVGFPDQADS